MRAASIQWEEIRKRLAASEAALNQALSGSQQRIAAVYRQRAIQLARDQSSPKAAEPGVPALIFRAARERYAIELRELAEVLPFTGCTELPAGPPSFRGLINVGGEIRAVIDLGLVLSGTRCGDTGFILMLHRKMGLKIDAIEELREIQADQAAPSSGRYVKSLAQGSLAVLDVETMLSAVFSGKER
ncbi:MAG TPA: chemotaxis protein CheW [Bryobacteraceae bacterium]|jgi:chemotaxis signal transduction protein|nr:chemotaxis protein CheW [Bryobacteraceae bacterium]